jgi:hypothetical protein
VTLALNECVASGVGTLYGQTGVSLQDGYRRDFDPSPDTVAVFRQSGGASVIHDYTEDYALQVLVDSKTVSGARTVARSIYNLLHERDAENIGGVNVLWLRGVAPPQDLGPGPAEGERFTVSVNFTARLLR